MSTPNVPYRVELRFELPGTPEEVWEAIATGPGITSWFLPTDLDQREGGAIVTHMGDTSSPGTVTGWEPPHRLAYEEPEWAELAGRAGAPVSPLATEFLVEAASGGTSVLRVVSSAFGTGADWEQEFIDDMARFWAPMFEHLRLYLTHFPGQQATTMEAGAPVGDGGSASEVLANMADALGAGGPGQRVDLHGVAAEVAQRNDVEVLARLVGPERGYLALYAFDHPDGSPYAGVRGYFFGDGAADLAASQEPAWAAWLEKLPVGVA